MARYFAQRIIVSHLLRSQLQLLKPALSPHLEKPSFSRFIWQSTLLHKDVEVSDHTCDISDFNDYLMNRKPIVQVLVQTLKEILNMSTSEINKIIKTYPQLKKKSRANILNNYYNLLEANVQKSTIENNIWLLTHQDDKLKDKLNCINILNMDNDKLVPWLRLTQQELTNYIFYVQNDTGTYTHNKIEHLAHRLECSIQELCELTIRYSFLLKIPISNIDKKLNILHEYNISNKNILKDLWVFRYSENHIQHRCELYKDTECLEIKPWAIRCPLKIISRTIQKHCVERSLIRHHGNITQYLINKLKVDKKTFKLAVIRWPVILRINLVKLDKLINILHESGITSNEMLQCGQIFYFNIETVQKRIKILKKENLVPKLSVLVVTEHLFERYISKKQLERKLLQPHNIQKYLIYKLNVDNKDLEIAIKKWPDILRVRPLKLVQLIDMLQQHGFTGHEILKHGRVFQFNVETLRKRLKILIEKDLTPKITVITFSQKCFDQYVKSKEIIKGT